MGVGADREMKSLSSPHGMAEAGCKTQLWRGRVGEVLLDTWPGQELHCACTEFFGLPPLPSTHSSWNYNHTEGLEPKKTPCGQSRGDWQPQGTAAHGEGTARVAGVALLLTQS